jgi:hypothetical protein
MDRPDNYVDLKGREISLRDLDADERRLLAKIQARAATQPPWNEYENYWVAAVASFYDARGLTRAESRRTAVYRIAQDLGGRIAVAAGLARLSDYRDELEEIIRTRFKTRRAFCEATGLSEDMLSHVLARRKDLSLESLTQALSRIGFRMRIVPISTEVAAGRNGVGEQPPVAV